MQTVPTDRDSGPTIPPDDAETIVRSILAARDHLRDTIDLVSTYSDLYGRLVEPHFGTTGNVCPEGKQVERDTGLGLVGDLLAEVAEVITERLGGTGSRGLTPEQYQSELNEVLASPLLCQAAVPVLRERTEEAMAELRQIDPDFDTSLGGAR